MNDVGRPNTAWTFGLFIIGEWSRRNEPFPPVGYHAQCGRSRSNDVGVHGVYRLGTCEASRFD